RKAFEQRAVGLFPGIPKPREAKELAVFDMDQHRLPSLAFFAPFVKAVRRHQTTAREKKVSESWPFRQRLGARVDHLVADRLILGPIRHQAPAHRPRFDGAGALDDGSDASASARYCSAA